MQYYMGRRRQRGHGIESVISGALKHIMPVLGSIGSKLLSTGKTVVGNVGKQLLNTGVNAAADFLQGKPAAAAVRTQATTTGRQLMANPMSLLHTQTFVPPPPPPPRRVRKAPAQKKKKKRPLKRRSQSKSASQTKAAKRRRRTQDIFDD